MQGSVRFSIARDWQDIQDHKIVFDNENEFKKDFLPLLKDFAIKPTPITIKNPQDNAILERVHQVLGDMLRTKNLQEYDFDKTLGVSYYPQ